MNFNTWITILFLKTGKLPGSQRCPLWGDLLTHTSRRDQGRLTDPSIEDEWASASGRLRQSEEWVSESREGVGRRWTMGGLGINGKRWQEREERRGWDNGGDKLRLWDAEWSWLEPLKIGFTTTVTMCGRQSARRVRGVVPWKHVTVVKE